MSRMRMKEKTALPRWAAGAALGAGLAALAFWPRGAADLCRTALLPVRILAAWTWEEWTDWSSALARAEELEELNGQLAQALAQSQAALARQELETGREALEEEYPALELTGIWLVGRDPALGGRLWACPAGGGELPQGLPVVDEQGFLVGVTGSGEDRGLVIPLSDPDFSAGCWVGDRQEAGILTGTGTGARVTGLPRDTLTRAGELAVTSGLGGVFPAGLPVGILEEPAPDPDAGSAAALLQPLAGWEDQRFFYLVTGVKNG